MRFNELKYLVMGKDYKINDNIIIHNPTLGEISEFDEMNYVILVNYITMRPYDDMVSLWDHGIDYEDLTDYDIFIRNVKAPGMTPEKTSILFGDLDFSEYEIAINEQNDEVVLTNGVNTIDRGIYQQIVDFIRFINFIETDNPNEIKPGSLSTKKYLIKRMRKKQEFNAKKEFKQNIASLASAIVNSPNTSLTYNDVENMHIGQLYDSFYRNLKRDNAHYVRQAIYGGTVSSKDVDNSVLEWFGSISKQSKEKER